MKRSFFVMGLGLALAWQAAPATELYRWVDREGKVHYGDTPVEDAEKLKISMPDTGPASGVDETKLPYEARMARKNFPVTLYASEKCGDPCDRGRDYLNKRHVPYTVTLVKTEEDVAALKQKSGSDNVPALSVGRTWIRGFQAEAWAGELDVAGYPK